MAMNTIFHGRDSACFPFIGQSIKLFYITIVVAAFIITLHGRICNAQATICNRDLKIINNSVLERNLTGRICNPQATICNRDFNYENGSVFESNLNTVFEILVQQTSQTGFSTSVHGQSPNQIYGLLNCRGDATEDICYNCSQRATAAIRESGGCGNAVGGTIWMDVCFLRYENYTFSGKTYSYGLYNSNVSDPKDFGDALRKLLSSLSTEAENGSTLYASGFTTDSLYQKIYGLVQCWRDISPDDCKTCLSNTTNDIFTTYPGNPGVQGLMANCIIRYEIYPFFNSIAPPPSPSPSPAPVLPTTPGLNGKTPTGKSSKKIPIILGVAAGLLLLLFICLFSWRRKLKPAIFGRPSEDNGHVEEDALINEDRQLVFTMETLQAATGSFHDDNKLGEGGFGAVYKGITPYGKEIAVKKLSLRSLQGQKEFLNEVKLVAKIQHRNLVNLLGCCVEGSERLLVYEYLPNKSLDKILFNPKKRNQLDWQKRYNIIMGIVRGLLYLHQDSQLRIIHRDIKASNILLDEKLNPKISDFGLAKLFPDDKSQVSTRVAGTFGYMAPESLQGQLSVKADVYSFGVLLLEIMTGRKNSDSNLQSSEMEMLLGWAWRLYKRGDILEIIDPSINERCDEEQACRCIHVGFLCTQADPLLRPQMSTVNLMLSSPFMEIPIPTKPPAFVLSHASQSANSAGAATTSSSVSFSHTSVGAPPPR